jgi:signal transduction histidine kinase
MVGIVASRAAGFRLLWIVAAFMLPITILALFLMQNVQKQLDTNARELAGVRFLQILAPVLLDAAEGKADSTNYKELIKEGPALAARVDSLGQFEPLLRLLNQKAVQPVSVLKLSYELTQSVGEASSIILDSSAETHYLGVASATSLPDLVVRLKQLQYAAHVAVSELNNRNLALVAAADGAQRENIRLLHSLVNSAKNVGRSNYAYLPILADFDIIEKENLRRTNGILYDFQATDPNSNLTLSTIASSTVASFDVYRSLWMKLFDKFTTLKIQQSAELDRQSSLILQASLLSVLIGLGSAIAMFRSTLRRLDDITNAQKDAVRAHNDAEALATRLAGMNDEMVGVNQELAHQMHMLKDAQDALVSKGRMEQLGQLTATIAHELRNPLGAVRTSAFLIERKIKGKELGFEAQLARINNGVSRCDDIITQLLDFSRTKPLSSRPSDLDHWLGTMIEEEAKQLPSAVSIECVLNLRERLVPFDPSRLQRAFINLLSNASEAMVGKGDDPSKFSSANPVIKISTDVEDDFAVIRIKDNGPGISAENLVKIREPLFTTKSFGTGLGLPAVDQILTQHHGRMVVNSALGAGAEFVLYLPLTFAQGQAA